MLVCPCDLMSQSLIDRLGSYMIGSTFLKLLPTAHLHLRRDLSPETSKNTYPVPFLYIFYMGTRTLGVHLTSSLGVQYLLNWPCKIWKEWRRESPRKLFEFPVCETPETSWVISDTTDWPLNTMMMVNSNVTWYQWLFLVPIKGGR